MRVRPAYVKQARVALKAKKQLARGCSLRGALPAPMNVELVNPCPARIRRNSARARSSPTWCVPHASPSSPFQPIALSPQPPLPKPRPSRDSLSTFCSRPGWEHTSPDRSGAGPPCHCPTDAPGDWQPERPEPSDRRHGAAPSGGKRARRRRPDAAVERGRSLARKRCALDPLCA